MNTLSPTPYPELNAALQELVDSAHQILNDDLVGVYLQGSFAVGDFDEYSDCDFIIAIRRDPSESQLQNLREMHRRIFDRGTEWARRLEGSYFPTAILRDYNRSGTDLWYIDNGHSELERSNHCNKVVIRWIIREKGVVLFGPEPATLVDPIPVDIVQHAILRSIIDSGQLVLDHPEDFNNRFYQSFIVLHNCRKLHDLVTGAVSSKRSGAEWAKQHLDRSWSGLIERALAERSNPAQSVREPADKTEFASTLKLLQEIMRLAREFAVSRRLVGRE